MGQPLGIRLKAHSDPFRRPLSDADHVNTQRSPPPGLERFILGLLQAAINHSWRYAVDQASTETKLPSGRTKCSVANFTASAYSVPGSEA